MANIFPYPLSEILFQRPASSFYEINFSIYLVDVYSIMKVYQTNYLTL